MMLHTLKYFLLSCTSLLLAACSGPKVLDLLVPSSGYTVHKNIAYGKHPREQLDVYIPEHASEGKHPVIVFFYGGSWKKGSKDEYRFIGQTFASRGYVTVVADYRLYPEVHFPEFMDDSARAVVWVREHIADYQGDKNNVFLLGHSAGAYNAVMLSLNEHYLKYSGGSDAWIRGTIGLAGPYDFLPFTDPVIIEIFSKEKDKLTQPIHYVRKNVPPMLLLTGDSDEEVLPRNSIILHDALKSRGNDVTLHIYHDVGHIGIILATAHWFTGKAPVIDDIETFIRLHKK